MIMLGVKQDFLMPGIAGSLLILFGIFQSIAIINYGSRRIKKALNEMGYKIGRWKVRSLMKEAGVCVRHRKKYKATTNSNHKQPIFENKLNRQFDVADTNQVYVGDITYIWTQEGWLYLAIVIDLFSRKVVGWSMSSRMKAQLVCDALRMAIWQRQPSAGLIAHSDRGSQYASKEYRRLLKDNGFTGSMSRLGDCWDTQFNMAWNAWLDLTRVGIGEVVPLR